MNSNFSITKAGWAWGANKNYYSGIMINLTEPLDSDKNSDKEQSKYPLGYARYYKSSQREPITAEVFVDDQPVAVVSSAHPKAIYLAPYHQYRIKIQPLGKSLYDYDKSEQQIVVYEGNVIPLKWQFSFEYLLFAPVKHLVNDHWQPLGQALLKSPHNFERTDMAGYIQASLTNEQKDLTFIDQDGVSCTAHLPESKLKEVYKSKRNVLVVKDYLRCV